MLDSAFCARAHRQSFLQLLTDEHCVFEQTCDVIGGSFKWVIDKYLKVSDAKLPKYFDSGLQTQFLQTTGKYLRKLHVPDLVSMQQVNLSRNILSELSLLCINLEELVFSDCDLTKSDVCSILPQLPRLRHLDLNKCRNLTGDMVVNINKNAKLLETVIFSDCSIVDDIPPNSLVRHNRIHTIEVINIGRVDRLVPFILQCQALRVLHVDNVQLNDLQLILTECPTLRSLFVSLKTSPHLTDSEYDTLIAHMQHLEILQLYLPQWIGTWKPLFDDQLLRLVHQCPKLRMLLASHITHRYMHRSYGFRLTETIHNLDKTHVSTTGESNKDRKSQLQTLVVGTIAVPTLLSLLSNCPHLSTFKIKFWGGMDEPALWTDFMTAISKSRVTSLDVGCCENLQRADLLQLHNMVSLSLTDSDLRHTDIVSLIDRNRQLKKLSLVNCSALVHSTLLYIVDKCNNLEELTFNNLDGNEIYDKSINSELVVKFIKLQRPKLKKLVVQLWC